jgi:hypothetical protein
MRGLPSRSDRTRLKKAAADNGFDLDLGLVGRWFLFENSRAPSYMSRLDSPFAVPHVAHAPDPAATRTP